MANNSHRHKAYFSPMAIPFMRAAIRNKTKLVPDRINGRLLSIRVIRSLYDNGFVRPSNGTTWAYDFDRIHITASGANAFTQFMKDKTEGHPRTRKYY